MAEKVKYFNPCSLLIHLIFVVGVDAPAFVKMLALK